MSIGRLMAYSVIVRKARQMKTMGIGFYSRVVPTMTFGRLDVDLFVGQLVVCGVAAADVG